MAHFQAIVAPLYLVILLSGNFVKTSEPAKK